MLQDKPILSRLLTEVFYASTCLDYITGYKLNWITHSIRIAINTLVLLTGFYVLILLHLIEVQDCTYHPLNAYLFDWLPHLPKTSRGLFYNIFLYLVAADVTCRLIIVSKSRRRPMRVDFFAAFFTTINRKLSKADKCNILLRLDDSYGQLPVLNERNDPNQIYKTTCFFWHKERFEQLEKLLNQYIIIAIITFIVFNSFIFITLEHATNRWLDDDISTQPIWLVAQRPDKYKVEFKNGLCQVNSGTTIRVVFTIILPIIIIDLGIQVSLLNMVHVVTMYIHLLWLDEVIVAVSKLVSIWSTQDNDNNLTSKTTFSSSAPSSSSSSLTSSSFSSSKRNNSTPFLYRKPSTESPFSLSRRNLKRATTDQAKVDPLRSTATTLSGSSDLLVERLSSFRIFRSYASNGSLSPYYSYYTQPNLLDILCKQSLTSSTATMILDEHRINNQSGRFIAAAAAATAAGTKSSPLAAAAATYQKFSSDSGSQSTSLAMTSMALSPMSIGHRLKTHELLEFATKNEVVALAGAIFDTDQYVSILNFWATLGPFGLLCIACVYYKKSQDSVERSLLYGLVGAGIFLGSSALCTAALFNARIRKLSRYVINFVSLLSPLNERRHFWDQLMMIWFTRGSVHIGYSVLDLYNATWHHLFQVAYWLSTAFLLVYA